MVYLGEDRLYSQFIVRNVLNDTFVLQYADDREFDWIADLIDHYSQHPFYDDNLGLVQHIQLRKPVYNKVMSLSYLAGVVIKKNVVDVPPVLADSLYDRAITF